MTISLIKRRRQRKETTSPPGSINAPMCSSIPCKMAPAPPCHREQTSGIVNSWLASCSSHICFHLIFLCCSSRIFDYDLILESSSTPTGVASSTWFSSPSLWLLLVYSARLIHVVSQESLLHLLSPLSRSCSGRQWHSDGDRNVMPSYNDACGSV